MSRADVILAACVDVDGCWVYQSPTKAEGYGYGGYAHRIVYEHMVADVPAGLVLDHLCRNRACCNPYHLDPVTTKVNNLRGAGFGAVNARKSKCPKGHEYSGVNVRGARICHTCKREKARESRRHRLLT